VLKNKKVSRVAMVSVLFVVLVFSVGLVLNKASGMIGISRAERIIINHLQVQHFSMPSDAKIELVEFGNDEIFRATGLQVFKISGGFREGEAFIIKDGLVQNTIPGIGGFGINDVRLSDFNGDGKKEIVYAFTHGSGMMNSDVAVYDPWLRYSTSHGGSWTMPLILESINDNSFYLLNAATNERMGKITGSSGGNPHDIHVDFGFDSVEKRLYVTAFPDPYTPLMSSSPGMRIDVSYNDLYGFVRYRAENGTFVKWEDDVVTDLGNDTTQLSGHPIYWRPLHNPQSGDLVTVTVLYHTNEPENVLAETVLPISYDGDNMYKIGTVPTYDTFSATIFVPRVWLDYFYDENMPWDSTIDLTLDEFPGAAFSWSPYAVTAFENGNATELFSGMPVWNVYLADLNGDGLPELCATISIGSGIVDNRVVIYDYANNRSYELQDRFYYDYSLSWENGRLVVVQKEYNNGSPGRGSEQVTGTMAILNGELVVIGIDRTIPVREPQKDVSGRWDYVESTEGSGEDERLLGSSEVEILNDFEIQAPFLEINEN
jgi:hypothetical protein